MRKAIFVSLLLGAVVVLAIALVAVAAANMSSTGSRGAGSKTAKSSPTVSHTADAAASSLLTVPAGWKF